MVNLVNYLTLKPLNAKTTTTTKIYILKYIILHSEFSNFTFRILQQFIRLFGLPNGDLFLISKNQTVITLLSIRSVTHFLILVFPEGTHRRKCNDDINYLHCD